MLQELLLASIMPLKRMRKQLLYLIVVSIFLILGTAAAIFFAKGYKLGFNGNNTIISGTGLLVATSSPNGAQVFVNGHLTTATDNTINLAPGDYDIKIFKDGYFPWQKKITVKQEVVSKADALLFPSAPKLESITNIGVLNPVIDPSGTKLAYLVASQSGLKNGIYVLDMSIRPIITLQNASNQIANDTIYAFSSSTISWSPDSTQILAKINLNGIMTDFLMKSTTLNDNPPDVTETLESVNLSWTKLKAEKDKALIDSLPKALKRSVTDDFSILQWSEDETKILYTASKSATIPQIIKPALVGTDSTPEIRNIEKGKVYVYDIKEDRNYQILDSFNPKEKTPLVWYPDSKHLVYVHDQKIDMMEYDGQNQTTVYAGPFVDSFVFPWPDATKLVILTNLGNSNLTPNLYTIGLK